MSAWRYDKLERLLAELDAGVDAAEVHGALTGYLCAGGRGRPEGWGKALAIDALERAQAEGGAIAGALQDWFEATATELADEDDTFTPMLPDDDVELQLRANALVSWCRGFLGGVGLAGPSARGSRSAEVEEALSDLARIAASKPTVSPGDADEESYAELVEFVRIAALMLRDECAAAARRH